jgi:hypothetical protein
VGYFEKGNKLGPGRPPGLLNKTTKTIKQVFEEVFVNLQNDPAAKLETWAKANPTEFYKIAIRLIPTQFLPADQEIKIHIVKEGKNGHIPELIQTAPEPTENFE